MPDCSICSRSDVDDIHRLVDSGGGVNETAKQFGIPKTTFKRHLAHRKPSEPKPADPKPSEPRTELVAHAPCKACLSAYREVIDRAILEGHDSSAIAKLVGNSVSHDTIHRHRQRCIAEMVQEARAAGVQIFAGEAKAKVRGLVKQAEGLVEGACGFGSEASYKDRAQALNAAKGVLELLAKLTGELGPDVEVKILATPQWRQLQTRVVEGVGRLAEHIADPMERVRALREFGDWMREVEGGGDGGVGQDRALAVRSG